VPVFHAAIKCEENTWKNFVDHRTFQMPGKWDADQEKADEGKSRENWIWIRHFE
jgi:hypothetical protein